MKFIGSLRLKGPIILRQHLSPHIFLGNTHEVQKCLRWLTGHTAYPSMPSELWGPPPLGVCGHIKVPFCPDSASSYPKLSFACCLNACHWHHLIDFSWYRDPIFVGVHNYTTRTATLANSKNGENQIRQRGTHLPLRTTVLALLTHSAVINEKLEPADNKEIQNWRTYSRAAAGHMTFYHLLQSLSKRSQPDERTVSVRLWWVAENTPTTRNIKWPLSLHFPNARYVYCTPRLLKPYFSSFIVIYTHTFISIPVIYGSCNSNISHLNWLWQLTSSGRPEMVQMLSGFSCPKQTADVDVM